MSDTDDALRREMAETIADFHGFDASQTDFDLADTLLAGPIAKHTAALRDSVAALQAENARLTEERDAAIKVQEMAAMSGGFHARSAENAERQRDAAEARVSELEAENKALRAPLSAETMRENWRCPDCRCRSFARVDELKPDGRFAPGPLIRCLDCKRTHPDPGSAPVEGWRPLQTAPQDGSVFLIASIEGTGPTLGHFKDGYFRLVMSDEKLRGFGRWFWQDLPPPPAEPSRDAQDGERG